MNERQKRILSGSILPTLLGLSGPTIVVLLVQTGVGVAETYFVSNLGTDALAGVALVFPALMLMQMMSNGGIGGGVSSAVARALGGGRRNDADSLVWHAIVSGAAFGAVFTAAEWLGGRWLFHIMGGNGDVLAAALGYGNVVFAGSILIWLTSLLAAALRGAGNVLVPAAVTLTGAIIVIPLSPALIFGWGPLPRMGVAGAGTAVICYYVVATATLLLYLRSRNSPLKLRIAAIEWRLLRDILKVGGLSSLSTVQINLTVAIVTGMVGRVGTDAVAGYGIASRLDYLLIPLGFGIGTGALTMVGINVGAGNFERARRIGWIAGLFGAGVMEAIGVAAATAPHAWLGMFTSDPNVLATGTLYFHIVAPFYGLIGLGMLLYFAGQGAGQVFWPVIAGTARLAIAGVGGWIIVARLGLGLPTLFVAVACAAVAYGGGTAVAMLLGPWRASPSPSPIAKAERVSA